MKRCQLPPLLKPGDLLQVIAPSGALREVEAFHQGVEIWRKRGYRVAISADIDNRWGYLAGKDGDRTFQLLNAWQDLECRGILCARGGYGSARLLEAKSGEFIFDSAFPSKWLIGFSDITALLWSLSTVGVAGVHAPVLTTLAKEPDWSIQRLFDLVERHTVTPLAGTGWGGGSACGTLLPANLTVATHLLGTPLQPDLDGVILALEDVTEAPYRIDRLLTQWRLSGALTKVRGIALGRFSRCEPPPNIPSLTIEEVLRDRLSDLSIPVVSDLPFGHDGANAALPVGIPVQLDGDTGILSFETTT
ncbi:peptidase U61 LD-carboxypeptidase A [Gloeocapsa sp. PCC 7428]|uniref:S66 peptidase family protein n=1 Tax=Gloeocapsa sp. PCC 7428 TaxID=1173026 RepID=UPI0002A5CE95|nr:LD-carboxypeptidase [Gloeocapsa sp. PCC 7428]AFZ29166.1 peptidase U61 LD-carboxypeptidase A [Gloeocapsa sp. PCC 7428]